MGSGFSAKRGIMRLRSFWLRFRVKRGIVSLRGLCLSAKRGIARLWGFGFKAACVTGWNKVGVEGYSETFGVVAYSMHILDSISVGIDVCWATILTTIIAGANNPSVGICCGFNIPRLDANMKRPLTRLQLLIEAARVCRRSFRLRISDADSGRESR